MMKLPTKLETKRQILRPYNTSDWSAFLQFMLCPQVTDYLNFTAEQTTPKGAKELFEMTLNSYRTTEPLFALVIAQKNNDLFIGSCGFSPLDKQQNCECFYVLLPEYWGQGFATEAMTKLLDYGFHQLGIKKAIAQINRDNLASIEVAKKLAMNYQGLVEFKGVRDRGMLFSLSQEDYSRRNGISVLPES
ncbi:MAG: GNAT family protein [Pleurocapsa sp. MO_226.B13]|nr:GNAT family protein [Pleurocapsa sp. MO_226.B13]